MSSSPSTVIGTKITKRKRITAPKASLALTERGVRILVASTEIGQGTRTMHAQIVADTLGLPYDAVEVNTADTSEVPDSGPTVASRTCMVVGKLVETAALGIRHILVDAGFLHPSHTRTEFLAACRHYVQSFGTLRATSQYTPPPGMSWEAVKTSGVWLGRNTETVRSS